MAKLAFLIITFLVLNLNLSAINSIGIKSGICQASQVWKERGNYFKKEYGYVNGFYIAGSIEMYSSKKFSLINDFGYCDKGYSENVLVINFDTIRTTYQTRVITHRISYVFINPMLKFRVDNFRWSRYVFAGIRLDHQVSRDIGRSRNDFSQSILGSNFGVGIEYLNKKIGICSEFQYHHDFTNQAKGDNFFHIPGLEIKNNALILSIGLKYYFNK